MCVLAAKVYSSKDGCKLILADIWNKNHRKENACIVQNHFDILKAENWDLRVNYTNFDQHLCDSKTRATEKKILLYKITFDVCKN